ncbi:PGF-pre-PGF domain-containing protein [Halorubrum sp. DTA46]|uniref:PGF-pre-PGF domain-containing protein n=1 Tax=Halorubrum sp. DTA46 TaxID=3402162 RepID=UPI003AAA89CB
MNATRALGLIALIVALVGLVTGGAAVGGVAAQGDGPPSTPAAYYGQVTVDDGDVPAGLTVEAVVDGEVRDTIETDTDGSFGGVGAFDEKLTVEGVSGATVTFRIGGAVAGTTEWESGANEEVSLAIGEVPSDPDDGSDPGDETGPGDETDPSDDGSVPGGDDDVSDAPGDTGGSSGAGGSPSTDDTSAGDQPADDVVDLPDGTEALGLETASTVVSEDGQTSSVAFDGETSVDGIEFGGAVEGDVDVTELDAASAITGPAPGASVSIVEITVPDTARDTPATIRTGVDAEHLDEAGIDDADLRLSRYADGEWQGLETTVIDRDSDRVVIEAETPGFSMFALSAVSEPEAAITAGADPIDVDQSVTLSGLQSTDEHGEIVAYEWDIAGETATGSTTGASFATPGEYDVTLTVTNDAGETDTTTDTMTVASTGDSTPTPVEEPGLFSTPTLVAVVIALLIALGIVAVVRRADR